MPDVAILTCATTTVGAEFLHQLDQGRGGPLDEIWVFVASDEEKERLAQIPCTLPVRHVQLDPHSDQDFEALNCLLATAQPRVLWLVNCREASPDSDAADCMRTVALTTVETCTRTLSFMGPGSRIVNLSSVTATIPDVALPQLSATSAFVLELTRLLNHELKGTGIHAVCVCPRPLSEDATPTDGAILSRVGTDSARSVVSRALAWSVLGIGVLIPSHKMRVASFLARHVPRQALFALEDAFGRPRTP